MKIAIIGSGIAGNTIAHHLYKDHDITLFEASDHIGGHTHTHSLDYDGRQYEIDTGFIVFNDWTYPNFIKLLNDLGVQSQTTKMSFSSRCESAGFEYNGNNLNGLFAQRKNLFRPAFYKMLIDILHFNRSAVALIQDKDYSLTLGDYLKSQSYGQLFINDYILPMGAAIWSSDPQEMLQFPAVTFVQFFANHGLLNIQNRPRWRTIKGGSKSYVDALTLPFIHRIRLNTPVRAINRYADRVEIVTDAHTSETFDYVFIATHSDQALNILAKPSDDESRVLGAIHYQNNEVVLHTDINQLPKNRRAWAAWNYLRLNDDNKQRVAVTYNMNILQNINSNHTFCVTLNNSAAIDPDKIIKKLCYTHPLFTPSAITAQADQKKLNGQNRSFYCGAYWRYGFHEDGVISAQNALQHFHQHVKNA